MRKIIIFFILLVVSVFPGSAKILDTLVIEGLSSNHPTVIRNAIPLRNGKNVTSADVKNSIKALHRLGVFSDIDFFISKETDSTVSLLLKVKEIPICEDIEYVGFKKIKPKDLEEKITLLEGRPVSNELLHDNLSVIKKEYSEKGFLLANVVAELVETKIPGNVIVKFKVKEGKKVRIKRININGVKAFKISKIKRKFKTKENKWYNSGEFNEKEYRLHLDSLMMFYHEEGYLDAKVVSDSVWYGKNLKDLFININLDEGKRYYVGKFFFTGNNVIETPILKSRVALKHGKKFQKNKYEMTKMLISNAYREEGYLWVQLKDQFRYTGKNRDTIDVVFNISEGRPAIVRKIGIQGNNKTYEKVIRRELRLYPAQKYRQSSMERSIREIMQLNYFDNVTPDLKPNDDGTIDLVFNVKEKDNIGQFSAGVLYSQVEGLGGNFNITIPNFRGKGQQVDATVEFQKSRQNVSVGFIEPWAFDRPFLFSVRGFGTRTIYSSPNDTLLSYGIRFGTGKRLKWPDDYFRADVAYQFSREQDRLGDSMVGSNMRLLSEGFASKLWLTLQRNDTDIPNFPTRGSIFSVKTEIAGLGGDYNYLKGTLSYDWYFPLWWKFVIGTQSKFGLLGTLQDTLNISRYDVFSGGGVYSDAQIRGYDDSNPPRFGGWGNPQNSKSMLALSAQIRFPILDQQLYAAVFGDMGNTWGSLAEVDPTNLYKGVGFGLRLMFPMIGLMGFDFAWGLDDPDHSHFTKDPNGFTFHFLMNRGF